LTRTGPADRASRYRPGTTVNNPFAIVRQCNAGIVPICSIRDIPSRCRSLGLSVPPHFAPRRFFARGLACTLLEVVIKIFKVQQITADTSLGAELFYGRPWGAVPTIPVTPVAATPCHPSGVGATLECLETPTDQIGVGRRFRGILYSDGGPTGICVMRVTGWGELMARRDTPEAKWISGSRRRRTGAIGRGPPACFRQATLLCFTEKPHRRAWRHRTFGSGLTRSAFRKSLPPRSCGFYCYDRLFTVRPHTCPS
jgi:hypothetical protein